MRLWQLGSQPPSFALLTGAQAAFFPDGQTLASASLDNMSFHSNTIYLFHVSTHDQRLIQELSGHRGRVTGIAVSADGQLLASGGEDGTIRLWGIPAQ